MKKRLLSLLMCALLIASAFILPSCGGDENALEQAGGETDTVTTSKNTPMTISIYSVTSEDTTPEAIELVEKALSAIAVRRFNTTIDLVLINEEDYVSQMLAKIRMSVNSYNTERLNNKALDPTEKEEIMQSNIDYRYPLDPENKKGEKVPYNVKQATNLPSDVLNGELDIFLVYMPEAGNQSMYLPGTSNSSMQWSMFDILYREEALVPLQSYLKGEYSSINQVLYAHALEYVTRPEDPFKADSKVNTFGIPNNYIYGEYDYLVFNELYIDKVFQGADKAMFVDSYSQFTYTPGENDTYEFGGTGALKTLYDELLAKQGTEGFDYKNVIKIFDTDEAYEEYLNNPDDTFAIGIVKGDLANMELFGQHDGLDVYIANKNTVTNKNQYCESMFCIGRPTLGKDEKGERTKRCLQIMDLLCNNKEFRNIFQYGVEGTHFTKYSEEVIPMESPRAESKYFMDMRYTGNMFILYTSSDMTEAMKKMSKNNWQLAKDQNVDLVPFTAGT